MIDVEKALKRLASCAGCTEDEIMYSRRMMPSTLRHLLWKEIYDEGAHPKTIASIFHRDRTTILYGLKHAQCVTKANGFGEPLKAFTEAMGDLLS